MSYTVSDLTNDILQRAGRLDNPAGITLLGAANSIQSLISKRLLDRRSDLLVNDSLAITLPSNARSASLPSGFIAMAEKPKTRDISQYMRGTVVSYVGSSLVITVTQSCGSQSLRFDIYTVPGKGETSVFRGVTNAVAVGSVGSTVTIAVASGLSIQADDDLCFIPHTMTLALTLDGRYTLQPHYLNEDHGDEHDIEWWEWYGLFGWEFEIYANYHETYKIVNTTIYIRPYSSVPTYITGKYFGLPTTLSDDSTIPWNNLFDEIFREGCIRILQKGIAIPESDEDFVLFFDREFNSVLNTRMHILPKTRSSRSTFM